MRSDQYANWLRTLTPSQLRKEESNMKQMIREPIAAGAKHIAEAKLKKIEQIKRKERWVEPEKTTCNTEGNLTPNFIIGYTKII